MKPAASLCLLAVLLVPTVAAGKDDAPADFDVTLALSFEQIVGEEDVRRELELQMITEMRRAGCFRSVELEKRGGQELPAEFADDRLRLTVAVREVFDETTYDTSIAQRTAPNRDYADELAYTSRFRVIVVAGLEHPASGRVLRSRQIRSGGSHRPLTHGEDARFMARNRALVELVQEIRVYVCKGGKKRLAKELGG